MARILIVDHDPRVRELLAEQLALGDHSVVTAEDAGAALRALTRETFDLVLLDADMPHMDGLELGASIRNDTKTAHVPLVFLTVKTDDATWQRVNFLRGSYLAKPVQTEELVRTVERSLYRSAERRRAARGNAAGAGHSRLRLRSLRDMP